MPYRTLADFLDDLGRAGELAAVDAEVDPCLEVAEVTRRVARENGPALLFRNVRGHDIPLLTNLFGTESRILRALGADSLEEATARIDRALNSGGSDGWLDRLRFGGKGGAAASYAPNRVKTGACQQVVKLGSDINLLELPLLRGTDSESAPDTANPRSASRQHIALRPAIHSAVMLSVEPDTTNQVFLQGDLQIMGRDTALAAWSDLADPSRIVSNYCRRGARMPLAIVIGGDPVVQLAAAAPLTSVNDPLGLTGFLRERPLDAVPCRSVDLLVPAESDIVIEGYFEPSAAEVATVPRLSPNGRIFRGRPGHVMHVTAVTHRANRVFPAMVAAVEDNEFGIRDRVFARIFLPCLKQRIPELIDFDLPLSGSARYLAVISIEKTYASQARRVASIAWAMRPFQFARLLIVVDAEIDVRNTEKVLAAIVQEASWKDDLWWLQAPCDPFDPTSHWYLPGQRLGIDATRKLRGEGGEKAAPYLRRDKKIENLVTERWAEYGLGPESES